MILPSGSLYELFMHQSYRIAQLDIESAIERVTPIVITTDQEEIERQIEIVQRGIEQSNDFKWLYQANDYMSNLLRLQSIGQQALTFTCDETEKKNVEFFSDDYTAGEIQCGKERLTTLQTVIISQEPDLKWIRQENYVYHLDYRRLLDWLAFEIGHSTYDPDKYSNDFIGKEFGVEGLYFTSLGNKLDKLVPPNFAEELSDFMIDFDSSSMYTKKDGTAYDYFGHQVKKPKNKNITYEDLLYYQNNYATSIIFSYIQGLSGQYGLSLKLLGLGNGLLDLYVVGLHREAAFYDELKNLGLKVQLFDMRRFQFLPKIERQVAGRR